MTESRPGKIGVVVGRFGPPHMGDLHVMEFAGHLVSRLSIIVCADTGDKSLPAISIERRMEWLKEMCPSAQAIVALPENQLDAFLLHDQSPDFVFSSDGNLARAAASALAAEYIPSGYTSSIPTLELATRPLLYWNQLPRCVRPHFVKRVCIFGPESTGKTTLAANLADHYKTVAAFEWARLMLDERNNELHEKDLPLFARGQIASEDTLARDANRVIFCDSDVLTTSIWSNWLYGRCDPWILEAANARGYDLYLLTHVDVPWVADPQRYLPDDRQAFFDKCLYELQSRNRSLVQISGDWETRFQTAVKAVDQLLA